MLTSRNKTIGLNHNCVLSVRILLIQSQRGRFQRYTWTPRVCSSVLVAGNEKEVASSPKTRAKRVAHASLGTEGSFDRDDDEVEVDESSSTAKVLRKSR